MATTTQPLFTALATSTKQIQNLLRCIAFNSTATVEINPTGIKFTTEEVHAVQASTILQKDLFSSYLLSPPTAEEDDVIPPFKLNIVALLETLSIFGLGEATTTHKNQNGGIASSFAAAFTTPALGLRATCKITYAEVGAPLTITIEEGSMKTVCRMTTYTTAHDYGEENEIPLDRNNLLLKIIMPSTWLYDAISELSNTNPEDFVVNASSLSSPYFALDSQGGSFGDVTVDFAPPRSDPAGMNLDKRKKPEVCEVFVVAAPPGSHGRVRQRYKFDFVKRAGKAMSLAYKVSIRMDRQGVLSLQFMVESAEHFANPNTPQGGENCGLLSFVDYRFVPLVDTDDTDNSYDEETNGLSQDDASGLDE